MIKFKTSAFFLHALSQERNNEDWVIFPLPQSISGRGISSSSSITTDEGFPLNVLAQAATRPHCSCPYWLGWPSKINWNPKRFTPLLSLLCNGELWVARGRCDLWHHGSFIFKFMSFVVSNVWESHFPSGCLWIALTAPQGWCFVRESTGTNHDPGKLVPYTDSHRRSLQRHKDWDARKRACLVSKLLSLE